MLAVLLLPAGLVVPAMSKSRGGAHGEGAERVESGCEVREVVTRNRTLDGGRSRRYESGAHRIGWAPLADKTQKSPKSRDFVDFCVSVSGN